MMKINRLLSLFVFLFITSIVSTGVYKSLELSLGINSNIHIATAYYARLTSPLTAVAGASDEIGEAQLITSSSTVSMDLASPPSSDSPICPPTISIIDILKTRGIDSSFSSRQMLAQKYDIFGYTGTMIQNEQLVYSIKNDLKCL